MKLAGLARTLLLVALTLVSAWQIGRGFGFFLLLVVFLITTLYHTARMIRHRDEWRLRLARLGIWSVVLAVVVAILAYWSSAARDEAELVAQEVLAYQLRTGSYPASLAEVALSEETLRTRWGIRYFVHAGQGGLSYPSLFMPLTSYEYAFGTRQWTTNAH